MTDGYISIPNWDKFQHYKDRKPAWIKLHLDLLGNDAWLGLSGDDAKLLITIWMLIGRYGNGRVPADKAWLERQSIVPLSRLYRAPNAPLTRPYRDPKSTLSNRYRGLERLKEAGLIAISDSKALERGYQTDSPEVLKNLEEEKDARASGAAMNGAVAHPRKELEAAIAQARCWRDEDGEPQHLVEHTVRQAWPDMADTIIKALTPKEPA